MTFQSLGFGSQTEKNPYVEKQVNQPIPKSNYLRGFSEEAGQNLVEVHMLAYPGMEIILGSSPSLP